VTEKESVSARRRQQRARQKIDASKGTDKGYTTAKAQTRDRRGTSKSEGGGWASTAASFARLHVIPSYQTAIKYKRKNPQTASMKRENPTSAASPYQCCTAINLKVTPPCQPSSHTAISTFKSHRHINLQVTPPYQPSSHTAMSTFKSHRHIKLQVTLPYQPSSHTAISTFKSHRHIKLQVTLPYQPSSHTAISNFKS
jgi:hypothetical protein